MCGPHRARSGWAPGNPGLPFGSLPAAAVPCDTVPGALLEPCWQLIPIATGVPEIFEITPSSSSSLLWKLGNRPLRAGQRPRGLLARCGEVSVFLLSTRGQLDGCAPGCPVVHALSPVHPRVIPRACGRRRVLTGRFRGSPRRHRRSATGCRFGRAVRDVRLRRSRAVTPRATLRPQTVHILGDNSSTSRPRRGW